MDRVCPVCQSTNTGAVFNNRKRVPYPRKLTYEQTSARQNCDYGGCWCSDCGSAWDEKYYTRDDETVNTNVRKYLFAKDGE